MTSDQHSAHCATPNHASRVDRFLQDLNELSAEAAVAGRDPAFLHQALDAGVRAVGGIRGFMALVNRESGELKIVATCGPDWVDEGRKLRLNLGHEESRGISGHVAVTGKPYITGDVAHDPYYLHVFEDVVSELAVPILSPSGQTRGIINVDSVAQNAFTADDCAHLTAIAQITATALAIEGFRNRERALIEIGTTLARTLDVDSLTSKVVDVAASVLRFEDCSVFVLDEATNHLVLRATTGSLAEHVGEPAYHVGEGLTGWVAQNGVAVRIAEPSKDARWAGRLNEMPQEQIGSFLAVPIMSRHKTLGVLRVLRGKSHAPWFSNQFTEVDERVLTTVASYLGAAIENAQSFERLVKSERMAAWGELSAKSAHMIGNRTFALKGDLNELHHLLESPGLDPFGESEKKRELVQLAASMDRGVERLEELLREFRDFVVATQLHAVEGDINALLQELTEESYPKRCCVELRTDLGTDIPPVKLDAGKLKRALSELIENAISFQPDGGFVEIKSRLLDHEERVQNRLAHARDYVLLEFSDAGPGVPDAIKERIFEPFYTSRVKGMGLGLSIVKGIIEAHGGLIRETGTPGKGARFQIFLPVGA